MMTSWYENPQLRPTFEEMKRVLEEILSVVSPNEAFEVHLRFNNKLIINILLNIYSKVYCVASIYMNIIQKKY